MKRKPATAFIFRAKIIHFSSLQIGEFSWSEPLPLLQVSLVGQRRPAASAL